MTAAATPSALRSRSLNTERQLAIATPVGRGLLAGSVLMAIIFCSANLAALDDITTDGATQLGLHAATVPALVFSLLAGAYSSSTERRFGFLEQRLLTDSDRSRWVSSKAAIQGLVGLVYGMLSVITALVTCTLVFWVRDASFDATSPDTIKALIGVVIAAPLLSIIGVFIGSLVPNTPAVVAGTLVWMLVVEPPIILGLPQVGRWLPTAGALALTNSPDPDLASQWAGGVSLTIYAVVAYALVSRRLAQIDV